MHRGGRRGRGSMGPHGRPVYPRSTIKYPRKSRYHIDNRRSPEEELTEAERFIIEDPPVHMHDDHNNKRRDGRWSRETDDRYLRHRERSEERYSRSRSREGRERVFYRGSRDRDRTSWHNDSDRSRDRDEDHRDDHGYREEEHEHEHREDNHEYRHDNGEPHRYHNDGTIDLREIIRNREEMRSPRSSSERNRSRNRYYDMDKPDPQDEYFDGMPVTKTNNVQHVYYDGVPVSNFQPKHDEHSRKQTRWSDQNLGLVGDESKSSTSQQMDQFKAKIPHHSEDITYPGQFISAKDSHPDIPVFDGLNQDITPKQFLHIIDDLGSKYGWQSDERKCQMAAKLQGAPKEWLMKDDRMCDEPWDKIKSMFVKAHPSDMDYHEMLKKMMERTKYENESFSNYFMFKTMLMNGIGIIGRRAVSCLIGGLHNPSLRKYCIQKNFATPDALYSYLNSKGPNVDSVPNHKNKTVAELPPQKSSHYSGSKTNSGSNSNSKLASHREPIATINLVNDHKPFSLSSANYELKHLLTVKIKNSMLDAYNDLSAHCLTITEEIAKSIRLEYNKRRTTVIGFRGVPVLALGDCEVTIAADQAIIRIRIYVVPNISQEKPIVIGKSFREHQDLNYVETDNGICFKQPKSYQNALFSMLEKRKEKT